MNKTVDNFCRDEIRTKRVNCLTWENYRKIISINKQNWILEKSKLRDLSKNQNFHLKLRNQKVLQEVKKSTLDSPAHAPLILWEIYQLRTELIINAPVKYNIEIIEKIHNNLRRFPFLKPNGCGCIHAKPNIWVLYEKLERLNFILRILMLIFTKE
jgi:hypothetical protein